MFCTLYFYSKIPVSILSTTLAFVEVQCDCLSMDSVRELYRTIEVPSGGTFFIIFMEDALTLCPGNLKWVKASTSTLHR